MCIYTKNDARKIYISIDTNSQHQAIEQAGRLAAYMHTWEWHLIDGFPASALSHISHYTNIIILRNVFELTAK